MFDAQLKEQGGARPYRLPQVQSDDYDFLSSLAENSNLLTGGIRESFADKIEMGKLREITLAKPILNNICVARRSGHKSDVLDSLWRIIKNL